MTNNANLELIPKEAAKEFVRQTAKLTRDLGGFLGKVFGTVPEDTVGVLGGDWLHHIRIRNAHRLQQRTDEILIERKAGVTKSLSPSEAIPLLSAAQDESRPELQELWARLLANAMDPTQPAINRGFINLIRELDILDAQIIQRLGDEGAVNEGIVFLDRRSGHDWRTDLQTTPDQFVISLNHLRDLKCTNAVITTENPSWEPRAADDYSIRRELHRPSLRVETYYHFVELEDQLRNETVEWEDICYDGGDLEFLLNYREPKNKPAQKDFFLQAMSNCVGTIFMNTFGRELLRALSLTGTPAKRRRKTTVRSRPRSRAHGTS